MWLRRRSTTAIWESEERPLSLRDVREALVRQLRAAAHAFDGEKQTEAQHREVERVEFHVPFEMLETAFDQWPIPSGRAGRTRPLGLLYQVVVRCPDERHDVRPAWERKWRWLQTQGGRHPHAVCVVQDTQVTDLLGLNLRAEAAPACVVAHTSAPHIRDVLDATLEGGVPVAVWRRGDRGKPYEEVQELAQLLAPEGGGVDEVDVLTLPRRVQELRRIHAAAAGQLDYAEDQFALLWDDPNSTMDIRSSLHGSLAREGSRP
jgi:hypothetical protein